MERAIDDFRRADGGYGKRREVAVRALCGWTPAQDRLRWRTGRVPFGVRPVRVVTPEPAVVPVPSSG